MSLSVHTCGTVWAKTGSKIASLFALLVTVLMPFLILAPSAVWAAEPVAVVDIVDSSYTVDFPSSMTFTVSIDNDVPVNDVRLCYAVERRQFVTVESELLAEFEPAEQVMAEVTLDMVRTGGLPPGSRIRYWWRITDAEGITVTSPADYVTFDDTRFDWQVMRSEHIILYWYDGDSDFAGTLIDAAEGALERLKESTGVSLSKPASIYIYSSSDDLRGAMIYPQEWTGGVAYTRFNTIAIGIARNQLDWGTRTIAHELTHLVIDQMTFNPYNDLPVWLDEGLAVYNEGELQAEFKLYLKKAARDESFRSIRAISSPFSAYADESALSYAESYSLVRYLVEQYGQEKMLELLETFSRGSEYDAAFVSVYGFTMDGLQAEWEPYATDLYAGVLGGIETGQYAVSAVALMAMAAIIVVKRRRWW